MAAHVWQLQPPPPLCLTPPRPPLRMVGAPRNYLERTSGDRSFFKSGLSNFLSLKTELSQISRLFRILCACARRARARTVHGRIKLKAPTEPRPRVRRIHIVLLQLIAPSRSRCTPPVSAFPPFLCRTRLETPPTCVCVPAPFSLPRPASPANIMAARSNSRACELQRRGLRVARSTSACPRSARAAAAAASPRAVAGCTPRPSTRSAASRATP